MYVKLSRNDLLALTLTILRTKPDITDPNSVPLIMLHIKFKADPSKDVGEGTS